MSAFDFGWLAAFGVLAMIFGSQPATKYSGAAIVVAAIAASVYVGIKP